MDNILRCETNTKMEGKMQYSVQSVFLFQFSCIIHVEIKLSIIKSSFSLQIFYKSYACGWLTSCITKGQNATSTNKREDNLMYARCMVWILTVWCQHSVLYFPKLIQDSLFTLTNTCNWGVLNYMCYMYASETVIFFSW